MVAPDCSARLDYFEASTERDLGDVGVGMLDVFRGTSRFPSSRDVQEQSLKAYCKRVWGWGRSTTGWP